jgi:NitT/TauT family transport system substrate-binding protein
MRTQRLTAKGRFLVFLLALIVIGGGVFAGFKTGFIKMPTKNNTGASAVSDAALPGEDSSTGTNSVSTETASKSNVINLSLDEWIGWKPIIDANGGTTTQSGSIYDKLGIKVNIKTIDDGTQSSDALIKGSLNAAGYTINRTAFLSKKFKDAGLDVVMPYITNYSNGGDGIIANSKYKSIESLVNAKIAVPRYSEAQTLVAWFTNKSDLSDAQKNKILKNNLVYFDTADDAAKAYFAGKVDAAATWQPYLSQAESSTDSGVLFSTKSSNKLIMDGILFRGDYAKANSDTVSKFIDGALQASSLYKTKFDAVKKVFPMFSGMSDSDIKSNTDDAGLADWTANENTLKNEAKGVYTDMCSVWKQFGESTNDSLVSTLFDTSYLDSLSSKYQSETSATKTTADTITDKQKSDAKSEQALLTKSSTINFVANTAKFSDTASATKVLDDFISIAKTLDGTIIQIEGNIAGDTADTAGQKLSEQRAQTVAKYFIANGIDSNRIIVVGNGASKQISSNSTEAGMAKNRRTDVFFKTVEK